MKQKTIKQRSASGLPFLLLLVFLSLSAFNVVAQKRISGVVKDVGGMPLPGVTVIQKGTTRGAVTDFDGNYAITLTSGTKTLVFSYIGFKSIEMPTGGKSTINVVLQEDVANLDEVIVVGYGTQKKESVVGAISQVKGEDLQRLNSGITNVWKLYKLPYRVL